MGGTKGIGTALPRVEDERFLTGRGRFVDDLLPAGTVFAHVLRSPHAHARIRSIDASSAGSLLVITARDLAGIGPLPCMALPPGDHVARLQPILAAEEVRYVGEAVALVIA